MAISTHRFLPLHFSPTISNRRLVLYNASFAPRKAPVTRCARRTGKRMYPSEKRKLEEIKKNLLTTEIRNREDGYWRISKLSVPAHKDPGKDFVGFSLPLLEAIAKVLEFPVPVMLPEEAFTILRKSFDARKVLKESAFVYTVDMDVKKLLHLELRTWDFISRLEPKFGLIEYMQDTKVPTGLLDMLDKDKIKVDGSNPSNGSARHEKRPRVAVVGSGPSGLFSALVLAEVGADVTLIERGQPVEQRGRDIGALVVRKVLSSESNFCFGEGGAGTWSDGKLVTRIGRNSDSVQAVDIKFNTRLDDLVVGNNQVKGVVVSNSKNEPGRSSDQEKLLFDAVVLAVGHSARDVYNTLLQNNIEMVLKNFAVGLRIEHPQELINSIQYSELASEVQSGRGRIPVADYKVAKNVSVDESGIENRSCYTFCLCPGGQV